MTPASALSLLTDLATRADAIALRWFRSSSLDVGSKADLSPVTQADLEIERVVRAAALAACPDLGLLGEEYGIEAQGGRTRLVIDPIDGTANFARGIPIFATLLAIEHDAELVAGLVSAPALRTRWSAARGLGAWRDEEAIRVSTIDRIEDAQVFHAGMGGADGLERVPGILPLLRRSKRQRGFGDFYQHVLVAEGAGEIAVDVGLSPWDIAALAIIVEEAGGRATTLEGRRDIHAGSFITGNVLLHDAALGILRGDGPRCDAGEPL
jgi:histidinol-phosphatase